MDFRRFIPKNSKLQKGMISEREMVSEREMFPEKALLVEKIKGIKKVAKLERIAQLERVTQLKRMAKLGRVTRLEKISLPDHRILKEQLRRSMLALKYGLAQETQETKKMLLVYQKYTRGEATEREVQEANRQFVNVLKSLGLSIVVILPFSPVTLPALVKLGDKLGVDILPDSFKDIDVAAEQQVSDNPETNKPSTNKPSLVDK